VINKLPTGWKKYPPNQLTYSDGFYQALYYMGEEKIGINVVQYSLNGEIHHEVEMQLPSEMTKNGCTMDVKVLGWGSEPRLQDAYRKMVIIIGDLCKFDALQDPK
jgi:hypothetical protein